MTASENPMTPSLREFLQQQLKYERKILDQRITLFEKQQLIREEARDRELAMAAAEYERRLQNLNHAAERAATIALTTVSRQTWEDFMKQYDETKLANAKELQAIATRAATWTLAIGLAFSILTLVIRFWPAAIHVS